MLLKSLQRWILGFYRAYVGFGDLGYVMRCCIFRCDNTSVFDCFPKHSLRIHAQHFWCSPFDKYDHVDSYQKLKAQFIFATIFSISSFIWSLFLLYFLKIVNSFFLSFIPIILSRTWLLDVYLAKVNETPLFHWIEVSHFSSTLYFIDILMVSSTLYCST